MVLLRLLLAALCAAALFGISIFVYSPLHHDDPISGGPCIFCAFQHLVAEPAAAAIQLSVSAPFLWLLLLPSSAPDSSAGRHTHFGRAPPPSFFAV